MHLLLRNRLIGGRSVEIYREIIKEKIGILRQHSDLGNYYGRSIFDVIEKVNIENKYPLLFRLPFKNNELSGFVGYKNECFSVFLNSSRTLGYEVFTAAHEIYHLLENKSIIKENTVLQEDETSRSTEVSENIADMFAAELLMPANDMSKQYDLLMSSNGFENPDEALIISLQQEYYVEYKAITKRLRELRKIDEILEQKLNKILDNGDGLTKLTQRLGFSNVLNVPSKAVYLPKKLLKSVEENYRNGSTTFDDLIVIFSYCDLSPQDFGYEEEGLSEDAKALEAKLRAELGE